MKKRNVLLTLACTTLLLSSCGKISAVYPDEDKALTNTQIELDHNTLNVIYKAIKGESNYTSSIKDILVNQIAEQVIGSYSVVKDAAAAGGYKIVLNGFDGKTDSEKTEFIKKHPAYKNWDHTGYKLTLSESEPSIADVEKRVEIIKGIIDSQIVKTMWNEVNTSSYKRNNRLYEISYAKKQYEDLNTVENKNGVIDSEKAKEIFYDNDVKYTEHYKYQSGKTGFIGFSEGGIDEYGYTNGVLINGKFDVNTEDGIKEIKKVLHFNFYTDYINSSLIPTILQNLLVEQYVLEEQYGNIGQTQSRQVNYIKIADNTSKNAKQFVNNFVSNYVLNEGMKTTSLSDKYLIAQDAWKGIYIENENVKRLAESVFSVATTENPSKNKDGHTADTNGKYNYIEGYGDNREIKYYKNTEFYDLVNKYSTLTNDANTNDSSNYSSFTSIDSMSYDPIVGFEIKTDEIRVEDFVTEGWETKDSTSLPDTIKNRLYSYAFVNEWNSYLKSSKQYVGAYIYQANDDEGSKFLRKESYSSIADSIIWEDSSSFYLVEVNDSITPELISIETDSTKDKSAVEKNVRTSAYSLASGSTYTTNALTHYLKQCNIDYHDQDVYDYFESTFPNLFED